MAYPIRVAASLALVTLLILTPVASATTRHLVQVTETGNTPFNVLFDRYRALISAGEISPDDAAGLRDDLSTLADQGDPQALNLLAIMTEQGIGRPANPEAGLALYYLAADRGSQDAAFNLSIREMQSPDATSQATGLARLDALSERDDLSDSLAAMVTGYRGWALAFGLREADGPGESAVALIETGLAASPDDARLHWAMAHLIEAEGPAPADRARLLHHYRQAGLNGHGLAAWRAGMMYLNGDGTEPDPAEGFRWVNLAAEAGLDDGVISLAVMYAVGQGTAPDPARARVLYDEAARRGNAHALRGLGFMLMFGEGGEADPARGVALTRLAADAGDVMAADLLDALAPQLPEDPNWDAAVADARDGFLRETGLTPDQLYGAQTLQPAAPTVAGYPD